MPELDLTMSRTRLADLRRGATLVITSPAVLRVRGSGALTCLQGLLTNDLEKPGDRSLVYGAMLTPKGMIVVDAWVLRRGDAFTLIVPPEGREKALEVFRRSLPPRLARLEDLSERVRVAWLIGDHAFHTLAQSGVGTPEAAGRLTAPDTAADAMVALGPEAAPFGALIAGPDLAVQALAARLASAGARQGDERDLDALRILAGWPALGREIDERTLPQEVRYDDLGGVSYTKGCYIGQETVARVHFRGHTNRELRGLLWDGAGDLDGRAVTAGEREVGTVRSTVTLEDRTIGLALLRREVAPGHAVIAGGRPATVVRLPFGTEALDA